MDSFLIRGIFKGNSPTIARKNNEEVGKKMFILSNGLYLDSFLYKINQMNLVITVYFKTKL